MVTVPPEIGLALALGAIITTLYFIQRRLRVGDDPSVRYSTENAAGSTSVLMSGTHATLFLMVLAAGGLWIAGLWESQLLLVIAVVGAVHYIVEKEEVAS